MDTMSGAGRPSALVLVAEDDDEIADILASYLARSGFRTLRARDGRQTLDLHLSARPDLVLLDVQMPLVNGWMVLAELRRRGTTPIIMVTAMDQDIDKLMGLRTGADDYVVKPFNPAEVVARAEAVLRRAAPPAHAGPRVIRIGALSIDLDRHEVVAQAQGQPVPVQLTLTEFRLLAHLAAAPQRVFSISRTSRSRYRATTSRAGWPKRLRYPAWTNAMRGCTASRNAAPDEVLLP